MSKNPRVYSCEIILYCCKTALNYVLDNYSEVSHYLYIQHNKDLESDGSKKKTHIHLYISFRRNLSFKKIAKDFSNLLLQFNSLVYPENLCFIEGSLSDCLIYATHRNDPDKWQYSESDCVSDKISHFRQSKGLSRDIGWQILEDMENGLSMRQMAIKYGREFIINWSRYDEFYRYMSSELRFRVKVDNKDEFCQENIFENT